MSRRHGEAGGERFEGDVGGEEAGGAGRRKLSLVELGAERGPGRQGTKLFLEKPPFACVTERA